MPVTSQEIPDFATISVFGLDIAEFDLMTFAPPGLDIPIAFILTDSLYPFWAQVDVSLQETNLNLEGGPPGTSEVRVGADRFLAKSEEGFDFDIGKFLLGPLASVLRSVIF